MGYFYCTLSMCPHIIFVYVTILLVHILFRDLSCQHSFQALYFIGFEEIMMHFIGICFNNSN